MNKSKLYLPIVILTISLLIALTRAFEGADEIVFNPIILWAIGPYFAIGLIYYFLIKQEELKSLVISSVVIMIFTIYSYSDISSSSTAGMVFLVAPPIILIGGLVLSLVLYSIEKGLKDKSAK